MRNWTKLLPWKLWWYSPKTKTDSKKYFCLNSLFLAGSSKILKPPCLLELICGALRDLLPFVQFKKREKLPCRSVNFNCRLEAYNFTKINTPPWVFFTFFKLYKWYQIAQHITFIYLFLFINERRKLLWAGDIQQKSICTMIPSNIKNWR